ncbi:FAD-dependent thymidylate synthase [Microlunatus parietis]|uniref:Thymidylate synthase ThyX n=1 Tax=Microlunatus parietis TaxID=682979 RepID=A0A7Y9LB57_9ACTN|nr:FAD-dependent thymidylate synthase [Microlunatus parietis]NYE70275.1 thymidylate synthase ThyX [Microlunatus parietis]
MGYGAKIIADSVSAAGHRLVTMEVTFPRLVLAEFNTHRMFSRNSASSRAIPVKTQLTRVRDNPFVPDVWGRNQAGMQAEREVGEATAAAAREAWLAARDRAVEQAERLLALKIHKQLANRLLEPFLWHTVIVTATDWSNFFALRANPEAQPEIGRVAALMQQAYGSGTPAVVGEGDWHLPLLQPEEYDGSFEHTEQARQVSAARCARVSYLTHDGRRDLDADLKLYRRLVESGHLSPLEHVATPDPGGARIGNFLGWRQLRKTIPGEDDFASWSDTALGD